MNRRLSLPALIAALKTGKKSRNPVTGNLCPSVAIPKPSLTAADFPMAPSAPHLSLPALPVPSLASPTHRSLKT